MYSSETNLIKLERKLTSVISLINLYPKYSGRYAMLFSTLRQSKSLQWSALWCENRLTFTILLLPQYVDRMLNNN